MGKFGGFNGGGMGNMQNLMKQAQKMQAEMLKKQEEVSVKEFEASAGGGAVIIKCTGDKLIKEVIIKPEVMADGDVEMLQDLIKVATNEAIGKAESAMQADLGQFNMPGLM
ncbi:MAG: YbaB/EbfC family nucleoid-associated protein [Clostridia bacterium]|nr:YbaB/EbfC family nucleoid-associated protein [Clostridia bacterium]MDD4386188.1 YbaB/EbfC family nucleoid-associated protein [Clostridia bacterium]